MFTAVKHQQPHGWQQKDTAFSPAAISAFTDCKGGPANIWQKKRVAELGPFIGLRSRAIGMTDVNRLSGNRVMVKRKCTTADRGSAKTTKRKVN